MCFQSFCGLQWGQWLWQEGQMAFNRPAQSTSVFPKIYLLAHKQVELVFQGPK